MKKLHLIGLFHTIPTPEYSHCAFTGRIFRFGKMMLPFGYEVIEYSNEGSQSEASEHVVMLDTETFELLKAKMNAAPPHGEANLDSSIYRAFTERLKYEMAQRISPGDIVCHPFGVAHADLAGIFPEARHVEIGIGYPECGLDFRIYETYQWWSWHQGKEQKPGNSYQWVCPMGYDLDDWKVNPAPGEYLLYFGRVIDCKGLQTVKEIAKHVDMPVIMCGSGYPEQFLDPEVPNLIYKEPVAGKDRSALLGGAKALLMPTVYCEPFGGAGVEGMLCGTPLLASDFGAFSETVIHGVTGYRCKTLGDWLSAVELVEYMNRGEIAQITRTKYSLESVGAQMDRIFKQISNLDKDGWYSLDPTFAIL